MSLEIWLAETQDDPPCGPDLEYDSAFLEIVAAAAGKPEQQYGATIIPAEAPEWRRIDELAAALLARSKDLRVIALLARAQTNVHGLTGLADAVHLAREILERHWDEVHPRVVVDGESDPFMRINAVGALADTGGLVRDVRQAPLMGSALGPITVRMAEAALTGATQPEGRSLAPDQLRSAMRDALAAGQPGPAALQAIVADLRAILVQFRERLSAEDVPDLAGLLLPLETVGKLVSAVAGVAAGAGDAAADIAAGAAAPASGGGFAGGPVRGRDDALRALDQVCEYLERNEPANPAPLLIRRAQRLMTMNFVDIIRELAPDSLGQVEVITGTKSSE